MTDDLLMFNNGTVIDDTRSFRTASGIRQRSVARRLFELDPLPFERLKLETTPRIDTVTSFVFTRAAERSWEVLNQHLAAPEGAVFWIGGPAGCGKTHFLDYVIALQSRAGALDAGGARGLVCGLEAEGRIDAAQLEVCLLRVLAEQIGADSRSGDPWPQMRGEAALNIALESARRTGVNAITVAIDFGLSECDAAAEFFIVLAQVAAKFRGVKFTVIAAGRSGAPGTARRLEVATRDESEEMMVAVRRARRLVAGAERHADVAYTGVNTADFAPDAIFPFHPAALSALRAIANPPASIPALSRLARKALGPSHDGDHTLDRLIYPTDLTMNAAISKQVAVRLAVSGRAALKIAYHALARLFQGNQKELAREIVDTLMLERVCGGKEPLAIEELGSRIPMLARGGAANPLRIVRSLLRLLEAQTGGVIRLQTNAARFDPEAARAPELASFNAAIALVRHFDPALNPAAEMEGLAVRLKKLKCAMADSVKAANHTRAAISSALGESHLQMPASHLDAIAQYIELAELGTTAMLKIGADPARRDAALHVIANYEPIADTATSIPRVRAMREYLSATGLRASPEIERSDESQTAALEIECELLAVELGPRIMTGAPRNLCALEARFQRFKWTYVQSYLSEHEAWRAKMEHLALVVDDVTRYRDALGRLNRMVVLGPPEGEELAARMLTLAASVVRCDLADSVAPQTTPRCSSCGFTLGAVAPDAELDDVMEHVRRGLAVKLAALSQNMIARLIREYDHDNRLEGFLRIMQAVQTDAMVWVLDEKLSRYLAHVLDDDLGDLLAIKPARAR